MKSKFLLLLLCIILLISASACSKNESESSVNSEATSASDNNGGDVVKLSEENTFDHENYNWAKLIAEAAFDKNTVIGSEALKVLEIEITETTSENISLKIKAPYIKDQLLLWFNENYSGTDSLEKEIVKLLQSEKKEYAFTLKYSVSKNNEPHIDFTTEFSNAATCGILEFTAVLEAEFIKELEEGVYD